ncbi:MAG: sugar transferase [candidate division WOR-3 bacterium]|nr:MAG: sugar transferase [candidate division WOR-3 bacterium]
MPRTILIISDAVIIAGSCVIALLLRHHGTVPVPEYWWTTLAFFIVSVIITYAYYGLYNHYLYTQRFLLVFRIFKAWSVICLAFIVNALVLNLSSVSHDMGFIAVFVAVSLIMQFFVRVLVVEKLLPGYFTVTGSVRTCRYVGPESMYRQIADFFAERPFTGLRICKDHDTDRQSGKLMDVFLYSTADTFKDLYEDITSSRVNGSTIHVASSLFNQLRIENEWCSIEGVPLYTFNEAKYRKVSDGASRIMDIIISVMSLVLLAPFFVIISIAIKMDSRGSIIYKQKRCGLDGRIFTFYKFRSMHQRVVSAMPESDKESALNISVSKEVTPSQKCVTDVGRLLRWASIDEWPQLLNVIKGDMSLVGPRPHRPAEVALYEEWHRDRLLVKQGLTGMWQVYGRGEMPCDKSIFLDLMYVKNKSLGLDIRLLLKTIPVVILGKGAY